MQLIGYFVKHKIISGILLLDFLIIIVLIVTFSIKNAKNAVIDIVVVPEIATVKIGNSTYNNGTFKVFGGSYNVVVAADGFEQKELTINLNNRETTKLYVFLEPEEKNINYYAKNFNWNDYKNLRIINDEEANKLYNILSINDKLPIEYYEYNKLNGQAEKSITIRAANDDDCNSYYCLEALMALTDDKQLVQKAIDSKGFNADDYAIKYKVY